MKHLDLFSGIGGFALAAEMVWDDVEHVFCDNEPFSQEILKKHWPNAPIYGDIRTLTADTEYARQLRTQDNRTDCGVQPEKQTRQKLFEPELEGACCLRTEEVGRYTVDLLTGGFPCQPFSQAGRRRGTEDSRHLWPEMLRVIREFHPRWVVGENVGGLVTWNNGMVLEQIHIDLEAEGYEVQSFIIPAVAVNAPHRRDRVWIVAHSRLEHGGERRDEKLGPSETVGASCELDPKRQDKDDSDSKRERLERREFKNPSGYSGLTGGDRGYQRPDWNQNWAEVAARLCRMDDGLPRRMDRSPRLKALGNAIVPQVAAEIFKAIKKIDP